MWLLLLLAAAAATPAPTPSPTPALTTATYQYGFNSYTGAVDTGALSATPFDSTSPMVRIARAASTSTTVALMYFNVSDIPAGAVCSSMSLVTTWNISSTGVAFIDYFILYRALVAWDSTTTTYAMTVTNPAQADNTTASFFSTRLRSLTTLTPGNVTLDISTTGCCWITGACTNNGMWIGNFGPAGSGNFYIYNAEAAQAYRPILTVTYYMPSPTPAPTANPTATPTAIPTATPTAAPTPAPTASPLRSLCGYAYYAHNATEAAPAVYAGVWGVTVQLYAGLTLSATALTGSDGSFCVNATPGNYSLVASSLELTNGLAAGPTGTAGSGRVDNIIVTNASLSPFAFGMVQSCLNPYGNCTWVNDTISCVCTQYGQAGELVYDSYSRRCVPLLDWVTYGCDPFSIAGAPCTVCLDNLTLVTVPLAAGGSTAYCVPSTCAPTCACCSWDTTRCIQCNAGYNLNGGDGSCAPAPTATPTAAPTALPTAIPTPSPTANPTASPTAVPTASPTALPTANPTVSPTPAPTPLISARARKRRCAA